MITIFHGRGSRSLRCIWLSEELGLGYQAEVVEFLKGANQLPAYLAVHPLGLLPAMRDGDLTLHESGAIVQYLLSRYGEGRLQPEAGTAAFGRYLQWFHFAEATLLPPVVLHMEHSFLKPEGERVPTVVEEASERIAKVMAYLEATLASGGYIAGDTFTAADIMLGYSLWLMTLFKLLPEEHVHAVRYLKRLMERPALQRALAA